MAIFQHLKKHCPSKIMKLAVGYHCKCCATIQHIVVYSFLRSRALCQIHFRKGGPEERCKHLFLRSRAPCQITKWWLMLENPRRKQLRRNYFIAFTIVEIGKYSVSFTHDWMIPQRNSLFPFIFFDLEFFFFVDNWTVDEFWRRHMPIVF